MLLCSVIACTVDSLYQWTRKILWEVLGFTEHADGAHDGLSFGPVVLLLWMGSMSSCVSTDCQPLNQSQEAG